jgi:enoyl-CoA hydratase/carnithine racemase
MEMLLTGEMFSAREAAEWGLVNRVVPLADLDATVDQYARRIAGRSRRVIATGKRAFYAQLDLGLDPAYRIAGETMACNMGFADAAEGIAAFIDKRPPRWRDE